MSSETCELHARLVRKTEQAVLLTNQKGPDDPITGKERQFWLPRSIIGTTSIIPDPKNPKDYPVFRCQVPIWKVEQDGLDDFVKG